MRQILDTIWFIGIAAVCNLMVWGMFTLLNVPHVDAVAYTQHSIPQAKRAEFVATTGVPTRVVVPDLGMDIPIASGTFDPNTEEWTLSDTSAYYATFSVPVNDSNGTTLVYGHARPTMFEPLQNVAPGTLAQIYTDNGKVFTYTFSDMHEVVPTDTSVLTDVGSPKLVLQTCSGPWDMYRALYSFNYQGHASI